MRVVPRYELFFLVFYALLIPLAGGAALLIAGQPELLPFLLPLLALYLFLASRRPLRRRRAARAALPGEWREFLLAHSAYYRGLADEGRSRFERDLRLFLAETRIVGTGGKPVSWRTRLLVGAGAAAMLHGRPDWEPPLTDGVTVYPGQRFDRNYRPGKGNIAGQAPERGPLLVAEASLEEGFADPHDGYNVLFHELAHFFDFEARESGMKLRQPPGETLPWARVIDRSYREHDFASSILPTYAAQNVAEFFAVASEAFFENPGRLHAAHPALFGILMEFYGQDPRAILNGDGLSAGLRPAPSWMRG